MAKRKFNFTQNAEEQNATKKVDNAETVMVPVENRDKSTVQSLLEKIDTPTNTAFNFKFVKRDKIVFHKKNDYPIKTIEELAESILNFGLIHNLETYYDLDNDQYILDSGERRTRAIDMLIEKYKDYADKESEGYKRYERNVKPFENGYPCNVKLQPMQQTGELPEDEIGILEQIDAEIRLIHANELVREKDTMQTKKKLDRLNELYHARNRILKHGEKINVNKELAKNLNISEKQVKNYKAIDKLIPELRAKFEESEITLKDGANYAKLSEEEQHQILTLIENGENKREITRLMDQMKTMKKEISEKEQNIEELENTVKEQEGLITKITKEQESIREQIKKELEENDPNRTIITELEQALNESKNSLTNEKNKLKRSVEQKDKVIAELEKKLHEKSNVMNINSELLRIQITLENSISELEQAFDKLNAAFISYDEITGEDEKSEEFRLKIKDILNKNKEKYK